MNPTTDYFEKRFAALKGGKGDAVATSSGMVVQLSTILMIMEIGDNFVVTLNLYGGRYNQFINLK